MWSLGMQTPGNYLEKITIMNAIIADKNYYDETGMQIEVGDLLQVYHFKGARRKRYYMYHIAILQQSPDQIDADFYWAGKEYHRTENKGHYWLRSVANKDTGLIKGTRIISKKKFNDEDRLRKEAKQRLYKITHGQ